MDSDQSAALEVHQTARAELSIAPLNWDSKLANDAQQYANQLASTDSGMQHSTQLRQQKQGENLASCPGHWPNAYTESSKLWYAEKKDWKGGVFQAENTQAVGHYTQMIWSGTTHVGMGLAISSAGTTYVVARYSPPGNYVGQSPAQGSKSGGAKKPTQGRQQRPGQQDSGRARKPAQGRHQRPGQRDGGSTRRPMPGRQQWTGQRDSPSGFQQPSLGGMQSPWPYQPFSPGVSMNGLPGGYTRPPPQLGILDPHEYNRWLTDPNLRYSPYNPLGPIVNPGGDPFSGAGSRSTGCCIIL